MKKEVTDVLETFSYCSDGDELSSFIEELKSILDYNKEKYSLIYIELESEYEYSESPALIIKGHRLETDKEEAKRLEVEKMQKEREYQQYLKLKEIFEKENCL